MTFRRSLVLAALFLVVAVPAAAHVSVTPGEAARGSTATLTFRVPNERDDASTVEVEIDLPDEQPIAEAEPRAPEGWTPEVTRDGDRVARVTWTAATGGGIPPDGAQQFEVVLGPMPSSGDTVVFKALQTYSDGEVVRWIELPPPGGAEPDHPAPIVRLTGEPVVTTTSEPPATTAAPTTTTIVADDGDDDDGGSNALGIAVVAVAALALAATAAVARRRR